MSAMRNLGIRLSFVLAGAILAGLAAQGRFNPSNSWGDLAPTPLKELKDGREERIQSLALWWKRQPVRDDQGFGSLADARRDDWVLQGSVHRLSEPAPAEGRPGGPVEKPVVSAVSGV